MNRWKKGLVLAVVALSLAAVDTPSVLPQDQDVQLEYRTGRALKIRVLQDSFRPEGDRTAKSQAVRVDEVIHNDLQLSDHFTVTRSWAKDETPFDVQAVIEGRLIIRGSEVTLSGEIKDFPARRPIGKSVYRGTTNDLRKLAHRFADDVVYQLTGERGVAETQIAFVAGTKGNRELYVMDFDGYRPQKLTQGGVAYSPTWSPDGSWLGFSWLHEKGWALYRVPAWGGQSTAMWGRGGLNISPAFSPGGGLLAFASSFEGNTEIYTMPAAGGSVRRLTKNRAIDTSPTWSPSGQQIAFSSDRSGTVQVYVMDADGANVRRLVYGFSYTDSPCWSPKGDRIAFVVRTGGGFDIYVVDVDGLDPRLVVTGRSNQNPRWSPDGRHLVFSSNRNGNWGLYVTDADGLHVRRLPAPGPEAKSPAWSPRPGSSATTLGSR
jgi:TolB protein